MAGALVREGTRIAIPGLPGTWFIWSKASRDDGPGAWFAIPADRPSIYEYVVVRIQDRRDQTTDTGYVVTLLRTQVRTGGGSAVTTPITATPSCTPGARSSARRRPRFRDSATAALEHEIAGRKAARTPRSRPRGAIRVGLPRHDPAVPLAEVPA